MLGKKDGLRKLRRVPLTAKETSVVVADEQDEWEKRAGEMSISANTFGFHLIPSPPPPVPEPLLHHSRYHSPRSAANGAQNVYCNGLNDSITAGGF